MILSNKKISYIYQYQLFIWGNFQTHRSWKISTMNIHNLYLNLTLVNIAAFFVLLTMHVCIYIYIYDI